MARRLRRLVSGALAGPVGGGVARAVLRALQDHPALERTNFHGRTVSLAGGPALAAGATAGAVVHRPEHAAASVIAGLGSGAVGLYDDLVGGRPEHAAK